VAELNYLPIKQAGLSTIYLRDVANIRDGFAPQTNIVRADGRRGVLSSVLKAGDASTIDVVKGIREILPRAAQTLPPQLKIQHLSDQSVFVSAAVSGVIREALIAACLTALMILLFLGSWRSTLIIAVSIPLSILTSVIILSFQGETINIMTLGGLALAVGILVDVLLGWRDGAFVCAAGGSGGLRHVGLLLLLADDRSHSCEVPVRRGRPPL
jgi:multidrug efflux pump subunit AcrB